MTGFMNSDGSSLIGALNPSNQGQALQVDGSGNLKVTGGGGGGGVVNLADPNTPANKAAVDASGNQLVKLASGAALAGGVNIIDAAGANKASVDVSGRLTLVPNQSVNAAQWNGATPGANNPVVVQDQLRSWLLNAQGFSATTSKQTAAGAITGGLSVFNPPASGKTLLVYSLTFIIGNNSFNQVNFTTSDPALGTAALVSNNKGGGAASVTTCSYANTNLTVAGTTKDYAGAATNTFVQVLSNGSAYVLPPGNGVVFYANISGANVWLASMAWIEM